MTRASRASVAIAAIALAAAPARAEQEPPTARRRAGAVGAAVVPGAIVHGAGHWVIGERRTARRLLVVQGAALGLAALGGLPIGVSGAASVTMPLLPLVIGGGALLIQSWLADVYGAAGGARLGGRPEARPPRLDVAAGYTFVGDPDLAFANLATLDAAAWIGRARLDGGLRLGDGFRDGGVAAAVRLRGPRADLAGGGDALDVIARVGGERRRDDGLAIVTGEVAIAGRLALARVGRTLDGSFATLALGVGVERVRTDGVAGADTQGVPLGRFGWGMWLGDGAGRHAELELWYEHRGDTLAGRLLLPLGANGFFGHLGATATAWRGAWGATAGVEVGSAWLVSLAVRWRLPGAR